MQVSAMNAPPKLLLLIISLTALPFLSTEARACSCVEYGAPPCAAFWRADAVFAGHVTDIKKPAHQPSGALPKALVHFVVEESYRGSVGTELDVATLSGTSCDTEFAKGERWLVYAYWDETTKRFEIHPCTRTQLLAHAEEDLAYIHSLKGKTPAQSIAGRVVQNKYTPLSGVKITAEGGGHKFETFTDSEGNYQISLPQAGVYTVRTSVPFAAVVVLYRTDEQLDVRPTDEQTVVEYKVNIPERSCHYRQLDVLEIDLHATAEISGRVLTDAGQPVTQGSIYLVDAEDSGDKSYAKIEENGSFKFEGVAVGRYFLVVNPDDAPPGEYDAPYPRTFYPGASDSAQATPLVITEGAKLENMNVTVRPQLKERIVQGQVVWADGRPAAQASVSLYDGAANSYIRSVTADEKGNFSLKVYGDFKYELLAQVYGEPRGRSQRIKVPSSGKLKPFRLVIKPYRLPDTTSTHPTPAQRQLTHISF
ncbi:MAG TPA: carboxypeptidase-like regulatory domain-containing protein [Pyrinomonadaceae bacterium]|nr:carboxypeptidase-like regulatory domain-containing protein [Pyrinomonadaceae bacterium]